MHFRIIQLGLLALVLLFLGTPWFAAGQDKDAVDAGEEEGDEAPTEPEPAGTSDRPEPVATDASDQPKAVRTADKSAAFVFGPLNTSVGREDAVLVLDERLSADEGMPGRVIRVDEVPFKDSEPLWILGGGSDEICAEGGVAPNWATVIDDARRHLDGLETATAQATLIQALDRLACTDAVIEREVLGQLYLLRGLAQFYEGGEEAARQDFRRAATVNPGIKWDDSYPPEPKMVYLKAREDIYLQARGRVESMFLPGEVLQVVVDGQTATSGKAGGIDVHPGFHLVQYLMPDQTLWSRVTYIEGGETRLLISRSGMAESIKIGGSDPTNAPVARALMQRLCDEWAVKTIYVADLTEGANDDAYVYRFTKEGARFERLLPPVRAVASGGTEPVDQRSTVEGLLVLPNAVAEGSTATISAEGSALTGDDRIYLGEYEVMNLQVSGVRTTFALPDKIPAGVYDMRVVAGDGTEASFPRAFSVIGDTRSQVVATTPQQIVVVQAGGAGPPEPEERLRIGFHWGFTYYRGTWANMDLEMDVRLAEGFCLDAGIGTYMVQKEYYPHAYWRAGFKVRWYPKIVHGFFSVNFQQLFEDLHMGPRMAVGLDFVVPHIKHFYFTIETGGGVMFKSERELYGWYHLMGGTGMRF